MTARDDVKGPIDGGLRSLDHVQLAIPRGGEARARAFYAAILGLEEVPKPAELAGRGGAWFRANDVVLHVGVDADFRPARKAHPAFRCAEYATFVRYLEDRDVAVVHDDHLFDGKPHCYIEDPFGNRIELIAR